MSLASLATLKPGDVLSARVAAIVQEGLARLITDLGAVEAAVPPGLAEGASLKLAVAETGPVLVLRILSDPAKGGSATERALPAGAVATPASDLRPAPLEAAPPPPRSAPPTAALAAAVAKAAANQAPPSELLATLRAALAEPRVASSLAPAVAAGARALIAGALDGTRPLDAASVQKAVQASGLFLEVRADAAPAPALASARDAKRLLLDLAAALAPEHGRSPVPEPPAGVRAAPPAAVGDRPAPAPPSATAVDADPDKTPAARPAAAAAEDVAAAVQPNASVPLRALVGDARLLAATLKAVLAQAGVSAPSPAPADPPSEDLNPSPPPARAEPTRAPPRADQPPRAERPAPLPALGAQAAASLTRIVERQAEAALDRIRLSQAASLPPDAGPAAPAGARSAPQAWVLDIPVALPRETANAQLRIRNEGGGGGAAAAGGPAWTVEFALDTTDSGPIHARLALSGAGLGVTLWAERAGALARLQDGAEALKTALADAAFDRAAVAVVGGAPRRAPLRSGALMDQHT